MLFLETTRIGITYGFTWGRTGQLVSSFTISQVRFHVALASIARQIQTCPITGLQARYRDPRTGVPYANAGAFRILSRLLAHEYVWSPAGAPGGIGVFVGHEKQRGAIGVPDSWGEAMAGVEDNWRKTRVEGKKEEKAKEREKEKEKEVRVGERRSSRIAGEAGEATDMVPVVMDVDKTTEGQS